MSYKATKPGISYILACFIVSLFIRAPFYVLLVFVAMCSVFWLFWLSCHYLPSDWLERLLWGSLIVARGSSPESPGRRVHVIFLVYCIASLFYYVFVSSLAPTMAYMTYYPTVMARYSLFVLKVPINPKQTNKHSPISVPQKFACTHPHHCSPRYRHTISELHTIQTADFWQEESCNGIVCILWQLWR